MTLLFLPATFVTFARAETQAVPVDGEPFRAELMAADADWRLTIRAGQRLRTMPAADLVCWGQCSEQGRAGGLVLADGGLLVARVVTADRRQLAAESALFGRLQLSVDSLAGIVFHPPSNQADGDKLLDRLARASGDSDRLLLDNGDELSGALIGIADDVANLETDVGPVSVKTERATALIFNPARRRKPAANQPALQAWTGFNDGSRLLATRLLVDGQSLKITASGQPLAASSSALIFLQPLGGRSVYLSDLKPAEYHQTPYFSLPWPYQSDRSVTGGLLRCGGRLYLKGLGVHSAARLVYELTPRPLGERQEKKDSPLPLGEGQGVRAKRFEADLAIDASTAGQGSVEFRVLVDGQEKFASGTIHGGHPPVPVSIDVTGAKKLELLVDYADRADVLDHADWLNARLTQ